MTLTLRWHRVLPDPHCPACGELPDDSPAAARLSIEPRIKPARDRYRLRSLTARAADLEAAYHDEETGLVRSLAHGAQGGLTVAAAEIGLRGDDATESGYGRSRDYRTARVTAIAEALERYAGMEPGGRRTTVRAPYADVRAQAVHPETLGLYPAAAYRQPGFPYRPFDERQLYRWVWGYSFARSAPVLLPESYVYYRSRRTHPDEPALVYEVSNGCALGSCLEEAVLHGILEVAERDAFLLTWYARMTPPRLDPASAGDPALPLLAATIEAETGYRVELFDITLEQGVPAVWALAADATGEPHRARAACAAACHPDQGQAALNALAELGPLLPDLGRAYAARADLAAAMARDASLVTEMEHHALLYAEPSVFDRFDFLTRSTQTVPLRPDILGGADLGADLTAMIGRYLATGLDVVVVDQTTPEQRAGGFTCVKVVVPGTLPMTFGQANRRVHGLPRLVSVPAALGRAVPRELNPHPHPFP
ncbi:hypothetical protein GCM10020358_58620 [Amorphoplanes nipponensis]|uniref:YcaO domain-containing protein n=1 Tax=Actinoplanes nipponensis TaxID=135950 RepID=A0A919JAP8_9ACTN|nr:TOMM precursor leader peptide-binding protein [Actinoplanes nipponensis]GIE46841.1 hypothetical protein Ani05nite_03750 [Actinoplanes nipponensis]